VRERALGRLIVELFRPAPQASFGHSLTTRAHCVAA
jgi:hypothetical protein